MILKNNCQLGCFPSPYFYNGEIYIEARTKNSKVMIGENVIINNNASIISDKSQVIIGDNTIIGPNFTCFDSDFHPISPDKRLSQDYKCKEVIIGKNVFIGANVMILKGVEIGDNSVISAGIVVSSNVPSNSILREKNNLDDSPIRT